MGESINRTIAPGMDSPVSASVISPLIEKFSELLYSSGADSAAKGSQSVSRKQRKILFVITGICGKCNS